MLSGVEDSGLRALGFGGLSGVQRLRLSGFKAVLVRVLQEFPGRVLSGHDDTMRTFGFSGVGSEHTAAKRGPRCRP